jgi:lipopolysaccharide export system protein LptA
MEPDPVKKSTLLALFLLLTLLAAQISGVSGAEPKKKEPAKKDTAREVPLHITAARMEADQNEGVVLFSGQVKAQQGDSILYADQLWVYFQTPPQPVPGSAPQPAPGSAPAPAPGAQAPPATEVKNAKGAKDSKDAKEAGKNSPLGDMGGEKITKIVARGQVRFVQEDRLATGQEAVYYKDRDEVVLTGNPQLWRGENTLIGERIIFNLKDNKMLVESSAQKRVEAHLYSSNTPSTTEAKASIPFGPKGQKSPRR